MTLSGSSRRLRYFTIGLLILISCAFAAGCIGTSAGGETGSKTIKVATLNVIKAPSYLGDYNFGLMNAIANPALLQMDNNSNIIGNVAREWYANDDCTEWTFVIDDRYHWSDGTPLTAEDVAFTLNYHGEKIASSAWIADTLIDTRVDGNTVTFTFNKPYARLDLELLSYFIIPKHVWETIDKPEEYASTGPYVGSGPYYIENIDINAAVLKFARNPYWKGDEPYYDTVEVHWFANADAASLALENGEMDTYWKYAASYPYASVASLEKNDRFGILETPSIGLCFVGFNLKEGAGADLNFRNAVSSAIDYDELVTICTLGYGAVPTRGFVPEGMSYYKEMPALTYDPESAGMQLEKAGYLDVDGDGYRENPDGSDLKLRLVIQSAYDREGELVAEYLRDVGIDVDLKNVEATTWYDIKDNYQYDITITRTTPWGMLMHANWGTGYFDSRRTGQGVLHNLDDPDFLNLCDKILATTEAADLERYAEELQQYYSDNLPGIAIYWKKDVTPINREITGWYSSQFKGIFNEINFLSIHPAT